MHSTSRTVRGGFLADGHETPGTDAAVAIPRDTGTTAGRSRRAPRHKPCVTMRTPSPAPTLYVGRATST
ncbi:hypothetical protein [Streptomyces yanii]|uniref:hypothetical protein n=1 Tax=Streptomyces yanii TaxID=78510 RepID=UPI0031EFAE22